MREIRRVEPTKPLLPRRKRVAAYAHVSSDKDAMLHSLSAQVSYYSGLVQANAEWEYAGVYVDDPVTGTKDTRTEFQRLLTDCRAGKLDMVITKSISRFARNTVTLLEAVRELKSLDVDVFFEEQNIHSLSGDGELLLTILASYAQEESRSVSENCKWRIRQDFREGKLTNWRFMFGYRITKGRVEIDPSQADIVRMIIGGTWRADRVYQILKNEKVAGNALLQKQFVTDHLTKRQVRNKGQLEQYFAEGTHPAIIDRETFDAAQSIREQRREHCGAKDTRSIRYPFSSMIVCGHCGKFYRRHMNHGKPTWQCSTFLQMGRAACPAQYIREAILETVIAGVMGLEFFDAVVFADSIVQIQVPEDYRLLFVGGIS